MQLLQDGDPIHRNRVAADSEYSSFGASWVSAQGGAEYGVRVFAFNPSGYSESSGVSTFRWEVPHAPGPVTGVSVRAIGPTTVRLAWTAEPEAGWYQVEASLPQRNRNWRDRRVWGRSRDAGAAWMDFEGLARGGRYRFRIVGANPTGHGVPSWVYLTLGERGTGPRGPSDFDWVLEGNRVRLSWKDNSSDELGFEVQYGLHGVYLLGQPQWERLLTVPADTESAVSDLPAFDGRRRFRVFAYNDRGYSVSTPRDPPLPPRGPPKASFASVGCSDDPCRVRTGEEIRFTDTSTGNVTERQWSFGDGATSDLSSPTHAWSTPGFYDVTLTVSDGSSSDSATRTVLVEAAAPAGSCRADAETLCLRDSRFEVKANWWSADGESGPGRVVYAGTDDSGMFQFFDPSNWEVLIKVLDGCGSNGRMWVLGASTTDLGYRIRVTDTITEESRTYVNEPGQPAPAIVDTEAFSGACGGAGP